MTTKRKTKRRTLKTPCGCRCRVLLPGPARPVSDDEGSFDTLWRRLFEDNANDYRMHFLPFLDARVKPPRWVLEADILLADTEREVLVCMECELDIRGDYTFGDDDIAPWANHPNDEGIEVAHIAWLN
jgi:hypothetical protein